MSGNGEPPKIATRCAVFAKTDLIHCQQQGYSLEAICAGLCKGLAHNIADTLIKGVTLRAPVVVVGGVSKNAKVMHYLSELIGHPVVVPESSELTGAIGCALIARHKVAQPARRRKLSLPRCSKRRIRTDTAFFRRSGVNDRLSPTLPATRNTFRTMLRSTCMIWRRRVKLRVRRPRKSDAKVETLPAYLGIDVGSTSTKAVLMEAGEDERILLGLYTRTMGQPIKATQSLLRVLDEIAGGTHDLHFDLCGVGTTGSGRTFIQKAVNADIAVDEISAHARAAYALNPKWIPSSKSGDRIRSSPS